jgi:hypothetical protein
MKNILFIAFACFSLLLSNGCKKKKSEPTVDPCANTVCLNGGTCNDGSCNCPPGYTGADCGTQIDPCAGTTCLNGGTCITGTCTCATGYTGVDCGTQITPTKVTITGIKVTKCPPLDGSTTWDPVVNQNPDIFAVVKQGANTLITTGSNSNVTTQTVTLSGGVPANVTDLVNQLNIELWDEDTPSVGDAHDSMGNINFSIYNSTNHFPTTLVVDNGVLTFELTLSYTY